MRNQGVVVVSNRTGNTWRLRTDSNGDFQIALPPGRYTLRLAWAYPQGPEWPLSVTQGVVHAPTVTEQTL